MAQRGRVLAVAGLEVAPDLVRQGEEQALLGRDDGLHVLRNRGNGNRAVLVQPTGRRDAGSNLRTTADGTGTAQNQDRRAKYLLYK